MANKIKGICTGGKSHLIQPNELFGHDEDDNLFVPPEDLNIYVELTTTKKNRTVIDFTDSGVVGNSSEKGKSKVSFISGSENGKGNDADGNPKTSLSTSYTELTTVFNKTADTEKFGIASIDIDFNSSYAPLIKIKFIDVRGASLFNTGNPPKSEYSSFFDLPYPIFTLKVKGYYGKAVKYCLHLTSWNARFNAQTGNFEITADFIGYTYAMLTDMLLGYLRAITKTESGYAKFLKAKSEMLDPNSLITINELLNKIEDVNTGVTKIEESNVNVQELDGTKNLKNAISRIEDLVNESIDKINKPTSADTAGYAVFVSPITNGLFGVHHTVEDAKQNRLDIKTFKQSMETQITNVNSLIETEGDKLKLSDYDNVKTFEYFRYAVVYSATTTDKSTNFRSAWELNDDGDFEEFEGNFSNWKKNHTNRWMNLDLFDFSTIKSNIKALNDQLDRKEKELKETISTTIQGTVTELLGFEPTIKNIFRIFTVHAEIFMECLKDTSKKAQDDIQGLRKAEFDKLQDKAFDIKKVDTQDTGTLPAIIYPWPLYRTPSDNKANKGGALEEAWLGKDILIPQNVPELVFVEDLLKGLLLVNKEDAERQARADNPGVIADSWYPVSPFDTPLFGITQNPYKTNEIGNTSNKLDPLLLMMERAFIFLGFSNRQLYSSEVEAMATFEANTANGGIMDSAVKLAMVSGDDDPTIANDIIKYFLDGGSSDGRKIAISQKPNTGRPFMYLNNSETHYYYKYIEGGDKKDEKFIPLNGDLHGSEFFDSNGKFLSASKIKKKTKGDDPSLLFLSPPGTNISGGPRPYRYGPTFMKIIDNSKYNNTAALQPRYETQDTTLQTWKDQVKTANGETDFVDYGTLYSIDRTKDFGNNQAEDIAGLNIFGNDAVSRYAFTTIAAINYSDSESSADEREIYPGGEAKGVSEAAFYTNADGYGSTSLASNNQPDNYKDSFGQENGMLTGYEISDRAKYKFKPTNGENAGIESEYYPVRNANRTRGLFSTTNSTIAHEDIGQNRGLFISDVNDICIPHIDFAVDSSIYSLFGSQLYFEQRRSSSPKSARAFLFLHTLPWNGLFIDDVAKYHSKGTQAALFNNKDSNVLSNIFGRKAAFIHAPKLWCAFMGGILWRNRSSTGTTENSSNDIIWEDDDSTTFKDYSGKVPSYKGGSGYYDPIVFGVRTNLINENSEFNPCYVPEVLEGGAIPFGNLPSRHHYLTHDSAAVPLHFSIDNEYKLISGVVKNLPLQIKEEFIKTFFEFVNSSQWETIRRNYEVFPNERDGNGNLKPNSWDNPNSGVNITYTNKGRTEHPSNWSGNSQEWVKLWENANNLDKNIINSTESIGSSIKPKQEKIKGEIKGIKSSWVENNFPNYKQYEYISSIRLKGSTASAPPPAKINLSNQVGYNWDIGYKPNTDTNNILVMLFKETVWIANGSYKPWVDHEADRYKNFDNTIAVNKPLLEQYVTAFVKEFRRINKVDTIKDEENDQLQQIFNTMDSDTIRLNIYRHCKTVYDKWIAGSQGNVLAACGTDKADITEKTSKKDRVSGSEHRLIDSFRFVNRAFNDLGDKYLLNPKIINDIVVGNLNQSFYDLISRVLADNNFNFIALPAFIDFNSTDEMASLFKAEIYNQELDEAVAGPTFVCVYVGQTSNKLDLGDGSDFPNDGFDFKCTDGQLEVQSLPLDFTKDKAEHEHNVVAFAVNYGHQNQNIFTDVKLDQKEFSETDESLQITDTIGQNGAQSNRTQAGQNLWNVYQVRSYSTEITAMGNAMIQPMMYFQLNNIPMFHGAYMIIKATHKITPNHMTTNFKGVRTRFIDTPLIDSNTIYMSMLGNIGNGDGSGVSSLDSVAGGTGGGSTYTPKGSYPPIIGTIIDNGGTNGAITQGTGNIFARQIPQIDGLNNRKLSLPDENAILFNAVAPLEKMMNAWVAWMKANGFKGQNGDGKFYATIESSFRSIAKQEQLEYQYRNQPGRAAPAGSSRHGWGIALDLGFYDKAGNKVPSNKSSKVGFGIDTNPAIQWLYDNAYIYGFTIPPELRDQKGTDEHWHWEYHGTAAKCLVTEHPRVWGYEVDPSKQQDSSVTNPKDRDGVRAKYADCTYRKVKTKVEGSETAGNYTKSTEGDSIITIPENKDLSPYDIIIVYGGLDRGPDWMLTEIEKSSVKLLNENIFLIVPYTTDWTKTEVLINKIKNNNKLNNFSIVGFSAGGKIAQQNIDKKSWNFIGLIDPLTNSNLISNTDVNSKTYMLYNQNHWSCCANIPKDQPALSAKINKKQNGNSEFLNIKHDDMVGTFFKKFKDQIS